MLHPVFRGRAVLQDESSKSHSPRMLTSKVLQMLKAVAASRKLQVFVGLQPSSQLLAVNINFRIFDVSTLESKWLAC